MSDQTHVNSFTILEIDTNILSLEKLTIPNLKYIICGKNFLQSGIFRSSHKTIRIYVSII